MQTLAPPRLDSSALSAAVDAAACAIEAQAIAWRRDLHANPELGNREFRTARVVADHLRSLGLDDVRTGVAHTGVVGLLKGALPGPVVALRADMDALPVAERTAAMLPTLQRVAGAAQTPLVPKVTGSEDFSFYQHVVPGLFWFIGVTPPGQDPLATPSNHSPLFYIDEAGLGLGVRSLAHAAVDFLETAKIKQTASSPRPCG